MSSWIESARTMSDEMLDEILGLPPLGANCRSGCPTPGFHASWGECARAANLQVGPADRNDRQVWDRDLAEYRKVRKQGIQPRSVRRGAVEAAKVVNDA